MLPEVKLSWIKEKRAYWIRLPAFLFLQRSKVSGARLTKRLGAVLLLRKRMCNKDGFPADDAKHVLEPEPFFEKHGLY